MAKNKEIKIRKRTAAEPWADIWYETTESGCRYWERVGERYISRSERQVARMLKKAGLKPKLGPAELQMGETLSEVDMGLRTIETSQIVDMAGPFAGWHAGLHQISGHPVLVTETLKLIEPKEPDEEAAALEEALPWGEHCRGWPLLGQLLNSRFASNEKLTADQMPTWAAVFRRCYKAIAAGSPLRCQSMVFAGDPSCGKSLLFAIMQHILGGRSYKPLRYLMGRSEFNKGMVYSPLLIVDDEGSDTKIASRKMLSANVKQIVATDALSCHGKGKDEYDIKTQRLLCFAVNMEEDNLMVLPPMDEDVEGKIHLFKYHGGPWPWPDSWTEDNIWSALSQEVPAFLHWLLNEFKLPTRLFDQRFGTLPYHHLEVLEGLDFLSPEARLLGWIERTVLSDRESWEGSASDLENELKGVDSPLTLHEKDKVPAANPALGKQLTKLARKPQHAGRIIQRRVAGTGQRLWRLVSQEAAEREMESQQKEVF